MGHRMSRRALIGGAAAAAGGALAGARARPVAAADDDIAEEDKIKQVEALYQQAPKGQQRCEICLQFNPPSKCRIVQGPINPKGWCQFFAARDDAH
jgi:hypothetical protein